MPQASSGPMASGAPSAALRPQLEPLDEGFASVLCVVAHPDDIEYGTAAAVDRWVKAGKTVTYLLASCGEAGIDGIPPGDNVEPAIKSLEAHDAYNSNLPASFAPARQLVTRILETGGQEAGMAYAVTFRRYAV